jgi:hypothetical protein
VLITLRLNQVAAPLCFAPAAGAYPPGPRTRCVEPSVGPRSTSPGPNYEAYRGPKPPPISHLGIDDAFFEKASEVWYIDAGKMAEADRGGLTWEAMRFTIKTINDELAERGYVARLAKGGGYSYFSLARLRISWTGQPTCQPLAA